MNDKFVPVMQKFISLFFLSLFLVLLGGCVKNDAQREFEEEALSGPSGFTKTDPTNGKILDNDPDDWRTSPFYQGQIEINPPFPNPVKTDQSLQLYIDVKWDQSVSGLFILTYREDNRPYYLYEDFETIQSEQKYVQLNNLFEFSTCYCAEGARGLKRIYIYDGNNRLISYGDIMIE